MSKSKIRLGINIDHIATIKTNRKTPYPSLTDAVKIAEDSGADLITIHLREDRRHIQDQDLRDIKAVARKLNLEMALLTKWSTFVFQQNQTSAALFQKEAKSLLRKEVWT